MSLPSPGPVDALMTWAQFRDLYERGILQEPINYSGLTSLGSKFTVRRRIVMDRKGKPFLSSKVTLQSIIITDSQGIEPAPATSYIIGFSSAATGVFRFTNPQNSGKTLYINEFHASQKSASTSGGQTEILINAPVSPAGGNDDSVAPVSTLAGGPDSVMTGGKAASPATVLGFTVRYIETMLNATTQFIGSLLFPVPRFVMPPNSSVDIDITSIATTTTVRVIIDWTEQ